MTKKKAFNFALVVFGFVILFLARGYAGTGFPEPSELQFSSGKLAVVETHAGDSHSRSTNKYPAFYDKKTRTIHEFSCAYNIINSDDDGCGSYEDFEPYIGKLVTIGWYEQHPLLGIQNKRRQMVTLTFDDSTIRSYEDTLADVRADQKFDRYYLLFLVIFSVRGYRYLNKTD